MDGSSCEVRIVISNRNFLKYSSIPLIMRETMLTIKERQIKVSHRDQLFVNEFIILKA